MVNSVCPGKTVCDTEGHPDDPKKSGYVSKVAPGDQRGMFVCAGVLFALGLRTMGSGLFDVKPSTPPFTAGLLGPCSATAADEIRGRPLGLELLVTQMARARIQRPHGSAVELTRGQRSFWSRHRSQAARLVTALFMV